jgi:hypothetical protein
MSPAGTHHGVLALDDGLRPDGTSRCTDTTLGTRMLFGSGVGTGELHLPEGTAVRLPAGQQIIMNLHLFNPGTDELTGTSGVLVRTAAAGTVVHEAEAVLMGRGFGLTVPPGESTLTVSCTMPADVTLIAAGPHMHVLGTHLRAVTEPLEGDPVVLWDAPYDFDQQELRLLAAPVPLSAGSRVRTECTYRNDTGQSVSFGGGTLDEMCFTNVFRYPAVADGVVCNQ